MSGFFGRPSRRFGVRILLMLTSTILSLLVLEAGFRIHDGISSFGSFLEKKRTLFEAAYPVLHDDELGWIPRPGASGTENVWGTRVTILPEGIRSNGTGSGRRKAGTILAVGDSFTFGDQVSDGESWPAQLEKILDTSVINGGVFAYGLDQSFLRAERLIPRYSPDTLIFSFIPNDITRCQLSEIMGVGKPFFEVIGGNRLILENQPTPPPRAYSIGPIRRMLSHSYLVHRLAMKIAPRTWIQGRENSRMEHENGLQVACLLLRRLEKLTRDAGIRLLVLIQYERDPSPDSLRSVAWLRSCAGLRDELILDLHPDLEKIRSTDPRRYARMFDGHMTAEGNLFVAKTLAEVLSETQGPAR